jgi:endoglucanase Acf2
MRAKTGPGIAGTALACLIATLGAGASCAAADPRVGIGRGSYATKAEAGFFGGALPPRPEYRSAAAAGEAATTNQWYSSVIFTRWSEALYAQPLTYRAVPEGFEIGMPDRRLVAQDTGQREIRYPHVAAILVAPTGFKAADARLADHSDWSAQIRMAASPDQALSATILHGSPFSYYELTSGDVRFHLTSAVTVLADPRSSGNDARVASFSIAGHAYAVFGPTGSTWDWSEPQELVLHLPAERRYFSVAGLPDERAATLHDFLRVAYVFPTGTHAAWRYDAASSRVRTTYTVDTVAKEGTQTTTFMGLYPHHWDALIAKPESTYTYDSVRGSIRLIAGNGFTTERIYHGILPEWPGLLDPAHRSAVDSLLVGDGAKAGGLYHKNNGNGTYWVGKGLAAVAQLASVAEAEDRVGLRDKLLGDMKSHMESWFDGKHSTYFAEDAGIGSFLGYPEEYNSITHMNDHHFHYGYWIMAAAHVALRDPEWASDAQWGGMVGKLVADIATDERGRADFPFLRNFDTYAGHSWASGDAASEDGNNQESSSEAINAWAALILWGEATGNTRLRDLGIYLYTTEVAAVQTYWFDLHHEVLAPEFGKPYASMVFGAKYAYNTWWTVEPHQIFGINLLPFTGASMYLGADPAYVRAIVADLPSEESRYAAHGVDDGTPKDIWQDVIASYLALADPQAALARWNKQGSVENGETRSHTLFWMSSLEEMGEPDPSVTADTALYSVFKAPNGTRTYLAYNAHDAPLHVTFSTNRTLDVPPHSIARASDAAQ